MSGKLVHVGDAATREMAENGEARNPVFDKAAADAARAAGLSDADIIDMFGYLPPPLFPVESELEEAGAGGPGHAAGRQ
jgi:hypothetical protein